MNYEYFFLLWDIWLWVVKQIMIEEICGPELEKLYYCHF